jgi:hypothetical protein
MIRFYRVLTVVILAVCVTASTVGAGKKPQPIPEDANEWQCQYMDLGDTGYMAVTGPWGTKNPVDYTVAVEKKYPDGTSSTCFDAKLRLAKLPRGFAEKPIKEVVRFDPVKRLVTFDLGGGQEVRCFLPTQ